MKIKMKLKGKAFFSSLTHTLYQSLIKEVLIVDPITFGMVSIGVAGGSLCLVSVLGTIGIKVNEEAIKLALEITKYGGMLYLLQHLSKLFF
jgi:hypothetical protein